MDGIRLVAIAEPFARAGPAGGTKPAGDSVPASDGRFRTAAGEGTRRWTDERVPGRPGPTREAGLDVLDRVLASRLDRAGAGTRWGIGSGGDEASASTRAARALHSARERGAELGFATGDPWRDALLADLGLALAALLADLTPRQAEIAGLILVGGARQAEVAAALGVSRATVSVTVARGRLPAIAGACRVIEGLLVGPPAAASRGAPGVSRGSRSR